METDDIDTGGEKTVSLKKQVVIIKFKSIIM